VDIEKVIAEIKKLVKLSNTDDIMTRLGIQEKISGYLIFLQEEEFKFLEAYKQAYTSRKIGEAEFIHGSSDGVTKAKETAAFERKELRQDETKWEVNYSRFKMFRESIKVHLDNMRQKTSFLRHEVELVKNQ
jgi:hypothetical protein